MVYKQFDDSPKIMFWYSVPWQNYNFKPTVIFKVFSDASRIVVMAIIKFIIVFRIYIPGLINWFFFTKKLTKSSKILRTLSKKYIVRFVWKKILWA